MKPLKSEESEEKTYFPDLPTLFLGGVFLLFPISHLPIFWLPLYWSEAALGIAFLLFFQKNSIRGSLLAFKKTLFEERWPFFWAAIFLLGIIVSFFTHSHDVSALGRLKSFYLAPAGLLLLTLTVVQKREQLHWLAKSWLWGILAAAGASLIAAYHGFYLYDGRLAGLYQSANYLALLIAPGVVLLLFFLATNFKKSGKIMGYIGLILSLAVIFLTRSYAVWLALFTSLFAVNLLFLLKKGWSRSFFAFFLLLSLIFTIFLSFERGSEKWKQLTLFDDHSSLASRLVIWRVARDIASENILLGIGTGNFQERYLDRQKYYPPYLEWAVPTPHNLFLHFLLEGGLLALIGWLGVVGTSLLRFWNTWKKEGTGDHESLAPLLGFSLLAFYLSYGLVDTPYMKNDLALALWGSIGFLLASLRARE